MAAMVNILASEKYDIVLLQTMNERIARYVIQSQVSLKLILTFNIMLKKIDCFKILF